MNRFVLPAIALALVLPFALPATSVGAAGVAPNLPECSASTVKVACVGYEDGTVTVCYQPSPGNLDPPPPVCRSLGPAVRPVSGCLGGDLVCYDVDGSSATVCYQTRPGDLDPPPPTCRTLVWGMGASGVFITERHCTPTTVGSARVCYETTSTCLTLVVVNSYRETCLIPEGGLLP